MKILRRIIAVIVLLLAVGLVGYLVFTGSRLSLPEEATETAEKCMRGVLWISG